MRDLIRWFFWYPLRYIVQYIPVPVQIIYKGAELFGIICFYFAKNKKMIMGEEYQKIFNDVTIKTVKEIVKKAFLNHCKNRIEVLLYPKLTQKMTEQLIQVKGKNYLDETLLKKNGAILLINHFGAGKLIMPALGHKGYVVNQLAEKPGYRVEANKVTKIFRKVRELEAKFENKFPVKFIYLSDSLRLLYECLRNNEILCINFDGLEGKKRIPIKFLNREFSFSKGVLNLAKKTKSPIIPTVVVRRKNNKHELIMEQPITLNNTDEENVADELQVLAKIFEKYIYKYPCHYGEFLYIATIKGANN